MANFADTTAKLIIQQCTRAKLQTNANSPDEDPQFLKIHRGIVAYVCFFKTSNDDTVEKMSQTICTVKLSKSLEDESKLVSIFDLPGSILVVPQATLGGKIKAKRMQYHSNINKEDGKKLYHLLLEKIRDFMTTKHDSEVYGGTYGNLQVLSIDTNGPYTHVVNFS